MHDAVKDDVEQQPKDHGTAIRIARGDVVVHNGSAFVVDAQWSFDKLFNNEVIDREMWEACMHIRWWWEAVQRSHLRCISLESIHTTGQAPVPDAEYINKLTAFDMLNKAMLAMHKQGQRERRQLWAPCWWLAIDELSLTQIARKLCKRKASALDQTRDALLLLHETLEDKKFLFWQRS
jgi:hypothetical protein